MEQTHRLNAYAIVSTNLASLSNHALSELLAKATPSENLAVGGGVAGLLEIDGTRIFFKKINLTDLERRPENVMSTRNIFELPLYYQYGIGSAGFGVWRELFIHNMTTNWVLTGVCQSFPLMYHWRILPKAIQPSSPEDLKILDELVAYWGGSQSIRLRLEAIQNASASLVLFLEHIPHTLEPWFEEKLTKDDATAKAAVAMVEQDLATVVAFMQSHGLLHFDAHFRNILTDGAHLYFADFGLALSSQFELSQDEITFFETHRNYDQYETAICLIDTIVSSLCGKESRKAVLHEYATGKGTSIKAPWASAIVTRYASMSIRMKDFYHKLCKDWSTSFPAKELESTVPRL